MCSTKHSPNAALDSASDELSADATQASEAPPTCEAVRPALFCVSVGVGEADDVCDVEDEGEDDDGDEA